MKKKATRKGKVVKRFGGTKKPGGKEVQVSPILSGIENV